MLHVLKFTIITKLFIKAVRLCDSKPTVLEILIWGQTREVTFEVEKPLVQVKPLLKYRFQSHCTALDLLPSESLFIKSVRLWKEKQTILNGLWV